MNNIYEQFYIGCCHGDLSKLIQLTNENSGILMSRSRAYTCFFCACLNGHIDVAKWLYPQLDQHVFFDPYLLIDVINNSKILEMAQWIYATFPIDIAKDYHFAFRSACELPNKDIAQWLISLKPYKYYIDARGNAGVRSDEDERWERRKYAMMFFYRTTNHKDVWRKIVEYV